MPTVDCVGLRHLVNDSCETHIAMCFDAIIGCSLRMILHIDNGLHKQRGRAGGGDAV